jgi:putative sterol carrier protein
VSTFKSAEELYEYIGKMLEMAVEDPDIAGATKDGDLVVALRYTGPDATLLVDFPNRTVKTGAEAEAVESPTVVLRMTADDGHRFWLGKLNLTMAMAQRKVKMEGSAAKALKLLPLTKPLFARYEALLRDRGRDDLLQR